MPKEQKLTEPIHRKHTVVLEVEDVWDNENKCWSVNARIGIKPQPNEKFTSLALQLGSYLLGEVQRILQEDPSPPPQLEITDKDKGRIILP